MPVMALGMAMSGVGMATAAAGLPPMWLGVSGDDYKTMFVMGGVIAIIGVVLFHIGVFVHCTIVAASWIIRLLFWTILHIASAINTALLLRSLETVIEYTEYAIVVGACCAAGGSLMVAISIVPWWTGLDLEFATPVLMAGGMWFAFGAGLIALGYAIQAIFRILSGVVLSAARWVNKTAFRMRNGGAARHLSVAGGGLPLAGCGAPVRQRKHGPCVVCAW